MIEIATILDGLIQRTNEGKLRWTRGAQMDVFVTSLDAISVVIRGRGSDYRLDIIDEAGETVETAAITQSSPPEQDRQLQSLHLLARRSALNIDGTLEKLAKALEL